MIAHRRLLVRFVRHLQVESLEQRNLLTVFTVNGTSDVIDEGDGLLSLREAIAAANELPGADRIEFMLGPETQQTVLLQHGPLQITDAVTIDGGGADRLTIDGNQQSRLFEISAGAGDVIFQRLSLAHGRLETTSADDDQPQHGSAIQSASICLLELHSVVVHDNRLQVEPLNRFERIHGGTVYSLGDIHVVDSVFHDNSSNEGAAGIQGMSKIDVDTSVFRANTGSAILSTGLITVNHSQIVDNDGGGISSGTGFVLQHSVMARNIGGGVGGASTGYVLDSAIMDNVGEFSSGVSAQQLTIESSTVARNVAQWFAGVSGTDVAILSSTISGNSATELKWRAGVEASSKLTIRFSTIVLNSTVSATDGGVIASGADVTIEDSIVALNSGDLTLRGVKLQVRNSLIGDGSNSGIKASSRDVPDADGNLIGGIDGPWVGPRIGPLVASSDTVWTHSLLPNSPAIDRGDPNLQSDAEGAPPFDQRGIGYPRVVGGRVDMGAHERQSLTASLALEPPSDATPDAVTLHFSQPVTGLSLADLKLTRNGDSQNLLIGNEVLRSVDAQTYRLSGLSSLGTIAGFHRLTLSSTTANLRGIDDARLDTDVTITWGVGRPAGIVVDTALDEADGRIDDGDVSLRDAIALAVAGEQITFAPELSGASIALTLGELVIDRDLTVDGSSLQDGIQITADGQRVFRIDDGNPQDSVVVLRGLSLTGGTNESTPLDSFFYGGAIYSAENLTVLESTISDSRATAGGAIRSVRPLTIRSSRIVGNWAFFGNGGAISSLADVWIEASEIAENRLHSREFEAGGGAIWSSGHVVIVDSVVRDNEDQEAVRYFDGGGGAIRADSVTLVSSSLLRNKATGPGGGILANFVEIRSSTLGENESESLCGGVWASVINVSFSTIVANLANDTGGLCGTVTLENSIVAINRGGLRPDVSRIASARFSLVGDIGAAEYPEAPLTASDANGNFIGGAQHGVIDPGLAPLANRGGPTLTYALLPTSPAINQADPASSELPMYDQRGTGYVRVAGGRADMGSNERQALTATWQVISPQRPLAVREISLTFTQPVTGFDVSDLRLTQRGESDNLLQGTETLSSSNDARDFTVSNLPLVNEPREYTLTLVAHGSDIRSETGDLLDSDASVQWQAGRSALPLIVNTLHDERDGRIDDGDISLRDALAAAVPGETIEFAAELDGQTIFLTEGEIVIDRAVTIDASRLPAGITLDGQRNPVTYRVPGYPVTRSRILQIDDGITVGNSPVTIRGLTITNGTSHEGGGAIYSTEPLTIESSTIVGNRSNGGGGAIAGTHRVTIIDSIIASNESRGFVGGGGIRALGDVTLVRSTLRDNRSSYNSDDSSGFGGGGVSANGSVEVVSSTLWDNQSNDFFSGGGVTAAEVTMRESTIAGNRADYGASAMTVHRATIYHSTLVGGVRVDESFTADHSIVTVGQPDDRSLIDFWLVGHASADIRFSIIGNGSGYLTETQPGVPDANGNLIGGPMFGPLDPRLGPLADNGGPTLTRALQPNSPAFELGDPTLLSGSADVPLVDQRGQPYARIVNQRVDVGAFERGRDGDANGDGQVDLADFVVLTTYFGNGALGWHQGNFDASDDGVQFGDFVLLANNFDRLAL